MKLSTMTIAALIIAAPAFAQVGPKGDKGDKGDTGYYVEAGANAGIASLAALGIVELDFDHRSGGLGFGAYAHQFGLAGKVGIPVGDGKLISLGAFGSEENQGLALGFSSRF